LNRHGKEIFLISHLFRKHAWIVDAHRDNGKRFVVRADEKLTAFLELARMISTHLLTKIANTHDRWRDETNRSQAAPLGLASV
jgi:hypothetical protein